MSKEAAAKKNLAVLEAYYETTGVQLPHAVGYEHCIIGVSEPSGFLEGDSEPRVVYDKGKILETLMSEDGMDEEEAEEFFSFNIIGSYIGKHTPIYIEVF